MCDFTELLRECLRAGLGLSSQRHYRPRGEKAEVPPHGFDETSGAHPALAPTAAWMIKSQLLSMGEVWEGQGSH